MNLQDLKNPNYKHYSTQINKKIGKTGIITVVTSYVTIIKFKLKTEIFGTKATVTVDKNYHPKYQYTMYFDTKGEEVTKEKFYAKKP